MSIEQDAASVGLAVKEHYLACEILPVPVRCYLESLQDSQVGICAQIFGKQISSFLNKIFEKSNGLSFLYINEK